MTLAVAAVALLVVAGGVAAVALRDAMAALLGLTVVVTLGSVVADPVPSPIALAVRIVGGILVAVVLRTALIAGAGDTAPAPGTSRDVRPLGSRDASEGDVGPDSSTLGWPAVSLLAVAGAAIGWAVTLAIGGVAGAATGIDAPGVGPSEATAVAGATAGALLLLGGLQTAFVREVRRSTVALVLLAQGVLVAMTALVGPLTDLGHVAAVALLVAAASGGTALASEPR
jgi:hypothetical protein